MEDRKFRRSGDHGDRLIASLDERTINMEKSLDRILNIHENRLNNIENFQTTSPCKAHDVRLQWLENMMKKTAYLLALVGVGISVWYFTVG